MTIIVKGTRSHAQFLGYDATGDHEWKRDRLDAIRFPSLQDARNSCSTYLDTGAKPKYVDGWDGHYEAYGEYEIQVYREKFGGKPGGRRWRFRFGYIDSGRPYVYSPSGLGYTSPESALKGAKQAVERKRRPLAG
jgi:hypothetical protein